METGLGYFEGHSEDFTLFSEMCVNLQKIQDIKITNCTAIITANVLHTVANDSVTYVVDVKALPFFSNWKKRRERFKNLCVSVVHNPHRQGAAYNQASELPY